MFDLNAIQNALQSAGLDGWLFYDFRGLNPLATRILQFSPGKHSTRRFFYFVPANGEPVKIVHRIESDALDHLPGSKRVYLAWQQLEHEVQEALATAREIAMEYSPMNAIPYVSRVDAGTVELIRSFGVTVVSSGDLIQQFEAVLSPEQWAGHQKVSQYTEQAFELAWNFIAEQIEQKGETKESDVLKVITDQFQKYDLFWDHDPIVGANGNAGLPHYVTGTGSNTTIRKGDLVLIDLWAKLKEPGSIYSDLTKTCVIGADHNPKYDEIFSYVIGGRDAALNLVREASAKRETVSGAAVDRACRQVIANAGYGDYFTHRTGHSLGQETHGNGAHVDDIETSDSRSLIPGTMFTIEPGIYLPEQNMGFRSEVDVYLTADFEVVVTGGTPQTGLKVIDV